VRPRWGGRQTQTNWSSRATQVPAFRQTSRLPLGLLSDWLRHGGPRYSAIPTARTEDFTRSWINDPPSYIYTVFRQTQSRWFLVITCVNVDRFSNIFTDRFPRKLPLYTWQKILPRFHYVVTLPCKIWNSKSYAFWAAKNFTILPCMVMNCTSANVHNAKSKRSKYPPSAAMC